MNVNFKLFIIVDNIHLTLSVGAFLILSKSAALGSGTAGALFLFEFRLLKFEAKYELLFSFPPDGDLGVGILFSKPSIGGGGGGGAADGYMR